MKHMYLQVMNASVVACEGHHMNTIWQYTQERTLDKNDI